MPYVIDYFNQGVLDEVESWPVDVLADYAWLVELFSEFGPALRMPHSRAMGRGLFELRPRGRGGVGRALHCFVHGRRVVVLHAFVKKAEGTDKADIDIARRRMKEVRDG